MLSEGKERKDYRRSVCMFVSADGGEKEGGGGL